MEKYKDIPGYEGRYQVSNFGKVVSLRKIIQKSNGAKYLMAKRVLKPTVNHKGYYMVKLYLKGNGKVYKVHQLVAMAFLNHKPCGMKLVVNHIDFNKTNNRVTNLEIVTNRENTNKIHRKSTSKYVGVSWDSARKQWRSRISLEDCNVHLGYTLNEREASEIYQTALAMVNQNAKAFENKISTKAGREALRNEILAIIHFQSMTNG